LNLAFESDQVKFDRPVDGSKLVDKTWFNVLVVHQNKYKGLFSGLNKRCSIMEGIFPKWIDLVVWGHEHESVPNITECEENGVYFLQPGSTVATSLIEDEAKQKHCFKLRVNKQ